MAFGTVSPSSARRAHLKSGLSPEYTLEPLASVHCTAGMCGAELFSSGAGQGAARVKSAGRGEDEKPRGGPGQGGAKKRVNQLILKFDKRAKIVTGVLQHYSVVF